MASSCLSSSPKCHFCSPGSVLFRLRQSVGGSWRSCLRWSGGDMPGARAVTHRGGDMSAFPVFPHAEDDKSQRGVKKEKGLLHPWPSRSVRSSLFPKSLLSPLSPFSPSGLVWANRPYMAPHHMQLDIPLFGYHQASGDVLSKTLEAADNRVCMKSAFSSRHVWM